MAIVQISKIIHRTGANVDLPQLDTGELGYATDEGKLYIGNDPAGSLPTIDGKYITEILTSTSTLDFSRIEGSQNASVNFSTLQDAQLIGVNVAANIATLVNVGGTSGGKINLGSVGNVKLTGGTNGYFLQTDGAGNLSWTSSVGNVTIPGTPGGSSTQLQFNNAGNFSGDSRLSFNLVTGNLYANAGVITPTVYGNVIGNVNGIIGANTPNTATFTSVTINNNLIATGNVTANYLIGTVVGQVANSLVSGTVYTNSQPNITSVGTLSDLDVAGNISANTVVLDTWSLFANVDGLFATDGSNTYSINMTQI